MKKNLKPLIIFIYTFLLAFIIYFFSVSNYEFIGYTIVVGFLFYFLLRLDKTYNFPVYSLWLFIGWVIMHMFGGGLYVKGEKLYALVLINLIGDPFFILRYDRFIHAYCYFAFSILIYYILKKHIKGKDSVLLIFTILSAIGIGLLNEVIEFGMVIFADAGQAVGGYYNTALDVVFNLIGAILGTLFVRKVSNKSQ